GRTDGAARGTCVQVDRDGHYAPGEIDPIPWLPRRARPTHLDTVDAHIEPVWLERRRSRADCRQDPAPVWIVAEQRALEQVVSRDGSTDLGRVVLRGRAANHNGDMLR